MLKRLALFLVITIAQFGLMYWVFFTYGPEAALKELGVFLVLAIVIGTVRRMRAQ